MVTRRLSLVALAALVGIACAPGASLAAEAPADVAGRWKGPWISRGSADRGEVDLTLEQRGATVTGELRLSGTRLRLDGPVEGSVEGNTLRFQQPGGQMRGDLTVDGDRMHGLVHGGVLPRTFDLKRQK